MPAPRLRPTGPSTTTIPPAMYSQQWSPAPSMTATAPEFRTANRRSEEHTSELQSRQYLVCRLLLEKKKKKTPYTNHQVCFYFLLPKKICPATRLPRVWRPTSAA